MYQNVSLVTFEDININKLRQQTISSMLYPRIKSESEHVVKQLNKSKSEPKLSTKTKTKTRVGTELDNGGLYTKMSTQNQLPAG